MFFRQFSPCLGRTVRFLGELLSAVFGTDAGLAMENCETTYLYAHTCASLRERERERFDVLFISHHITLYRTITVHSIMYIFIAIFISYSYYTHNITSYRIISHHITSNLISHHITSHYHITSDQIMSRHNVSHHITSHPNHIVSYHIMPYHITHIE